MPILTIAHLKAIAKGPAPLAAKLVGPINKHAADHGILDDPLLMAHFLAHMAVETAWFTRLVENLNYTTTKRLRQVWPSRFRTDAAAKPFVRNPQALANKVYGGRLGNTGPNDGWLYRGAGSYQLTGKANFKTFGDVAGVDLVGNPALAQDPDTSVKVAAAYFAKRMKAAAARDDIVASTKALNGGTHALADRKAALARAKAALAVVPAVKPGKATPKPTKPDIYDGQKHPEVERFQTRARELRYFEVGEVDGRWGLRSEATAAAIRANLGLPAGKLDDDLTLAMAKASPRPIADTRKTATVEDLKDAPAVKDGMALEKGGKVATGAGLAGTAAVVLEKITGGLDMTDLTEKVTSLQGFVSAVWTAAPFLLLAVGGYFVFTYGKSFVLGQVAAYREGRHV